MRHDQPLPMGGPCFQCPMCNRVECAGPVFPQYGVMPWMVPTGNHPVIPPPPTCPCCQFPPNPRIDELSKFFGACNNPMGADMPYPCGPLLDPAPTTTKRPPNKEAKRATLERERRFTKKARKEEIKRRVRFVDRCANKLLNSPCMSFHESEEENCQGRCRMEDPCGPCSPCVRPSPCCAQDCLTDRVDRLTRQVEKLVKQICKERKGKGKKENRQSLGKDKSVEPSKQANLKDALLSYIPAYYHEDVTPYVNLPSTSDNFPRKSPSEFYAYVKRDKKKRGILNRGDSEMYDKKQFRKQIEDKRNKNRSSSSETPTETEIVYREKRNKGPKIGR